MLTLACHAMGCRFELVLADYAGPAQELRAIGELVIAEIVELDARLSRFRSDSLLAHMQRQPLGRPVRVDAQTATLLAEAMSTWAASGGLFDIAVGDEVDRAVGGERLSDLQLGASSVDPGVPGLIVDEAACTVTRVRDGVLDLGGIAKGHAIDCALATLREHGITSAFLHGGTSAIGAIGAPPDGGSWEVAIAVPAGIELTLASMEPGDRGPEPPPMPCVASVGTQLVLALRDRCLAVSAPHGRAGGGGHHIIDPRTRRSADSAAIAIVLGPSCRTCDAWTKPALIARRRPMALASSYQVWIGNRR